MGEEGLGAAVPIGRLMAGKNEGVWSHASAQGDSRVKNALLFILIYMRDLINILLNTAHGVNAFVASQLGVRGAGVGHQHNQLNVHSHSCLGVPTLGPTAQLPKSVQPQQRWRVLGNP